MRSRPLLFVLASLVAISFAARWSGASSGTGDPAVRVVVPGLSAERPPAATRPYRMGWFLQTPQPTIESLLRTMPEQAKVSDAVLLQREVPWSRIQAGVPMETIFKEEYDDLVAYLRGLGLEVMFLVDPLDGLNRTRESNEMRKIGGSLKDAGLQRLHEQWVELLATRYRPQFLGCASEINTLGAHGDRELYDAIKGICNRLAPRLRQAVLGIRFFVSFQVDDAWDRRPFVHSDVDQFAMTREFDIDVLGLSTYPSFFFNDPSDIPADYFRRLQVASGKPVLVAEGGWSADPTRTGTTAESIARQTAFYRRFFDLLDSVDVEAAILLLYADLDMETWISFAGTQGVDIEGLRNFARMGIVDERLSPRPAAEVWGEHSRRPFVP